MRRPAADRGGPRRDASPVECGYSPFPWGFSAPARSGARSFGWRGEGVAQRQEQASKLEWDRRLDRDDRCHSGRLRGPLCCCARADPPAAHSFAPHVFLCSSASLGKLVARLARRGSTGRL